MRINNDLSLNEYTLLSYTQSSLVLRMEEEIRRVNLLVSRTEEIELSNSLSISSLQSKLARSVSFSN